MYLNVSGAEKIILYISTRSTFTQKLDGVGPVDNRLSTEYLYHFVQKKKKKRKKKITCDL